MLCALRAERIFRMRLKYKNTKRGFGATFCVLVYGCWYLLFADWFRLVLSCILFDGHNGILCGFAVEHLHL